MKLTKLMKKKLLFVCTANQQRSPTAEELFKNSNKYDAKSCGIHPLSEKFITREAINWADIIFCMDEIHKKFILENFPESKKKDIRVLNIPDVYYKNDLN